MAIGLIIVATSLGIWGAVLLFHYSDLNIRSDERLQIKDWTTLSIISISCTVLVTLGVFKGLSTSLAVSTFVATALLVQVGLTLVSLRNFAAFVIEGFIEIHRRRNRGLAEGYYLLGTQICFLLLFIGLVVNNAEMTRKKK